MVSFSVNKFIAFIRLLCVLSLLLTLQMGSAFSQKLKTQLQGDKPNIDSNAIKSWPLSPVMHSISKDGRFVIYYISSEDNTSRNSLVVESTSGKWRQVFSSVNGRCQAKFSNNSSFVLISRPGSDTVNVLNLKTFSRITLLNIKAFDFINVKGEESLVYLSRNSGKKLSISSLSGKLKYSFSNAESFILNNNSNRLIIKCKSNDGFETLAYLNTDDLSIRYIWDGIRSGNFILIDNQVAFVGEKSINQHAIKSIFHYKAGEVGAKEILKNNSNLFLQGYTINSIEKISEDGKRIFAQFKQKSPIDKLDKNVAKVNIWSYSDPKLKSQQLKESVNETIIASIDIYNDSISILKQVDEDILYYDLADHFVLLRKNGLGDTHNEWNWNKTALSTIFIRSYKSGKEQIIDTQVSDLILQSYSFSNDGNYIIYFDPNKQDYFSYSIRTNKKVNITKGISAQWTLLDRQDEPQSNHLTISNPLAFIHGSNHILLYDRYDIYEVDPSGILFPRNITNGFGSKNNLTFRFTANEVATGKTIRRDQTIILSAFNNKNKQYGFFSLLINSRKNPVLLSIDDYNYEAPILIKAYNASMYVVKRMTGSSFPNLFLSKDLKHFTPLTQIHPEKKYNWIKLKLITWNTFDGTESQGILYTPENIDTLKKYPLILTYYTKVSNGLNKFVNPDYTTGPIDIPYFVSNGYIVFCPDITIKVGYPGRSAYNSVVSAANYLSNLSFIDPKKMAVCGHSFAGFETNYLITKTQIFAAAFSAASMSNFISCYNSVLVLGDGTSRQRQYELAHDGMGATLWEKLDLYMENSPVLNADKIKTPLLMMHNMTDSDVPFSQSIEFFTALRRLGKTAWMLEYEGGDHMVGDEQAKDLTIRVKQFFDYYLKQTPAPLWMIDGIAAKDKGRITGLELDTLGRIPGPGLLIEK